MAKPSLDLKRTSATSVSGTPLLYDSGVKYDDATAFYDRWYPGDVVSNQGEIPTILASAEKIKTDSGAEDVKLDSAQEKVKLGSKQEDVTIKDIEEL